MLRARAAIQSLQEYHPPLGDRSGLRLDFNENTVGASPRVLRRLQQLTLEDLARYPVREPVEAQAAEFLGLQREEVLLTNGVDEAFICSARRTLNPAMRRSLLCLPLRCTKSALGPPVLAWCVCRRRRTSDFHWNRC